MSEYEYSFEVNDWADYIKFCEENGYVLIEDTKQTRTIFRHPNKINARVTVDEFAGKTVKKLDFKQDLLHDDEAAIERKESLPIEFQDDEAVKSILDILGYKEDNTMLRMRKTYKKGDVKFELDHYLSPRKTFVVAIEGKKDETDKVYQQISKLGLGKNK